MEEVFGSDEKGLKAQSHIPSRTSSAPKNEEFWSVRCDSLGVRQNSLII